jgi:hypothetical protein
MGRFHFAEPVMPLKTPKAIRVEHEEMRDLLVRITHERGRVGEAALRVKRLLDPHMEKEERCAMPVLGLLPELVESGATVAITEALPLVDELHAEYENLLAEHRMIAAAIEEMLDAGKAENKPDCVDAALLILNHAYMEESVLYPAAMLVGQEIRRRL